MRQCCTYAIIFDKGETVKHLIDMNSVSNEKRDYYSSLISGDFIFFISFNFISQRYNLVIGIYNIRQTNLIYIYIQILQVTDMHYYAGTKTREE